MVHELPGAPLPCTELPSLSTKEIRFVQQVLSQRQAIKKSTLKAIFAGSKGPEEKRRQRSAVKTTEQ